jgi:hypothetical protein
MDGKTSNFRNRQALRQLKEVSVQLATICYGDLVCFEWNGNEAYTVTVALDNLKLYKSSDLQGSLNARKVCFEVCSPSWKKEEAERAITAGSMVCLRNIFTNSYLALSSNILPASQMSYQIVLQPSITKECLFRLQSTNPDSR